MGEGIIERLIIRRVRVPLIRPYKLSFGPVDAFDMVLVEVMARDGRRGWGEATVLTGYTQETIEQAWAAALEISDDLIGKTIAAAKNHALKTYAATPFTQTAFVTALEMAEGHPVLSADDERMTPLLAIINATERGAIGAEIEARLAEGYETLKIKVGFDLRPDMERLAFIQDRVAGRAALRVDANQGYTQGEGVSFVGGIDPADIELVEQTCAEGDWQAAVAVAAEARKSEVPVMLDESIFGIDDIDRAADLNCADIIKLKLMKMGGLEALADGLRHIQKRHMRPVLGNGVAGDIGCWMEACISVDMLDTAGEMNGFLKPQTRLFEVPMIVRDGNLVLRAGGDVAVDEDALSAHTLDRVERS